MPDLTRELWATRTVPDRRMVRGKGKEGERERARCMNGQKERGGREREGGRERRGEGGGVVYCLWVW